MITQRDNTQDEPLSSLDHVPVEQFVHEVYGAATPPERDNMVSQLIGKLYLAAPPPERGALIKSLMQPLGAISLIAIANGVFAKIRFQGGFYNPQVRLEDLQAVQLEDVVALANRVQQVSGHAINGLAQMIASSPTLASSAVALVLIKILMGRAKSIRNDDSRIRSVPHVPERRARPG